MSFALVYNQEVNCTWPDITGPIGPVGVSLPTSSVRQG